MLPFVVLRCHFASFCVLVYRGPDVTTKRKPYPSLYPYPTLIPRVRFLTGHVVSLMVGTKVGSQMAITNAQLSAKVDKLASAVSQLATIVLAQQPAGGVPQAVPIIAPVVTTTANGKASWHVVGPYGNYNCEAASVRSRKAAETGRKKGDGRKHVLPNGAKALTIGAAFTTGNGQVWTRTG